MEKKYTRKRIIIAVIASFLVPLLVAMFITPIIISIEPNYSKVAFLPYLTIVIQTLYVLYVDFKHNMIAE